MSNVTLYTKDTCPYCFAAKALLKDKNVAYIEYEISDDPDRRSEMIARAGRMTVPQIFIDGYHVGGYDDLATLDGAGKLDALLAGNRPEGVAA